MMAVASRRRSTGTMECDWSQRRNEWGALYLQIRNTFLFLNLAESRGLWRMQWKSLVVLTGDAWLDREHCQSWIYEVVCTFTTGI